VVEVRLDGGSAGELGRVVQGQVLLEVLKPNR
jgi:hypothetical protein